MNDELSLLLFTAASIGFIHTLLGPDHYLPFIVLARARQWSLGRTTLITVLCGIGHVVGSIVLGVIGIALGIGVSRLEAVEARRGDLAAWLLICVGLVYAAWGLHRAGKRHGHSHAHPHGQDKTTLTPWMLFLIFVLGPCEPLIPVLMYPAATASTEAVLLVAGVFALTTIATMIGAVLLGVLGVTLLPLGRLEQYGHVMAGGAIALCGVGIQFLGL